MDNEAAWASPGAREKSGKAGRRAGESVQWNPELIGGFRGVGSECQPISAGCRSAFVSAENVNLEI